LSGAKKEQEFILSPDDGDRNIMRQWPLLYPLTDSEIFCKTLILKRGVYEDGTFSTSPFAEIACSNLC
jgi:hypothetical protein